MMAFPTRFSIEKQCLLIALLASPIICGCGPATIKVPDKFTEYNSQDGTFAINYPEGWDAEGTGSRSRGMAYAIFSKGDMEIRLDASFFDSLAAGGQAGQMIVGGEEAFKQLPPEQMIQEKHLEWFEENFEKYEEDAGESLRIPLGASYVNEFSAQKGWIKVKGMRATTMGRDRSVTFHAFCPASKWKDFRPVFRKMFEELKAGVEQ